MVNFSDYRYSKSRKVDFLGQGKTKLITQYLALFSKSSSGLGRMTEKRLVGNALCHSRILFD